MRIQIQTATGLKKSRILAIAAAALLLLNLADVVSTWIAVSTGKGVEANPLVLLLGGPFSPVSFFLKVVVIPAAILSVAVWMARRSNLKLAMATILLPAAVFATAVANNVIVAAKKVEKTAKKVVKVGR